MPLIWVKPFATSLALKISKIHITELSPTSGATFNGPDYEFESIKEINMKPTTNHYPYTNTSVKISIENA